MKTSVRALAILLPALLVHRPAVAHADDASRDEAQRLRNHGAAALEHGDATTAAADFRRAYALVPSPNLVYDLGLALDQLGRCVEAVDAFESFLDAAPNALPEARSFASTRLRSLESCVAHLELRVAPADARVTVDGRALALPRARALPVSPGDHLITVDKPPLAGRIEHVTVGAGEHRALSLALAPAASPVAAPHVAIPAPAPRPAATERTHKRTWLVVGVVGGALVAGLAVGLGVAFGSAQSDPRPTFGAVGVR